MSGVKVNDACIKMWEQLKSGKIKACNFKLSDNLKEIVVEDDSVVAKGTENAWDVWTKSLPDKECRYGSVLPHMRIIYFWIFLKPRANPQCFFTHKTLATEIK